MKIGRLNKLEILKQVTFGLYLDDGDRGEILLPKRYVPKDFQLGELIEVFVYRDSEDRLIATTEKPGIMVGQCAFLKVQAVNRVGAFLDWGLPKDLLVPFNQQAETMVEGKSYVVVAYVDDKTERIAGSSKLSRFLSEEGTRFKVGQKVELLIVSRSELGFKAVIDGTHLGLIFHREVTRPITVGQTVPGFIKHVRSDDHRVDLALDAGRALTRGDLQEKILAFLNDNNGESAITDRSPPEQILELFGASKSNYKKALGALYKLHKISIERERIVLVPKEVAKKLAAKEKSSSRPIKEKPQDKTVDLKTSGEEKNKKFNPWTKKHQSGSTSPENPGKARSQTTSDTKTAAKVDKKVAGSTLGKSSPWSGKSWSKKK